MNERQRLWLYQAEAQLGEALTQLAVPDKTRNLMALAQQRIQFALQQEPAAWPPPNSAYEWVAKGPQCGHENVFETQPGSLNNSTCSRCGVSMAGATPSLEIRDVP